jgi:hypothetical protein
VEAEAQNVERRLQQVRRNVGEERRDPSICGDEVPVEVDRQGRPGLVGGEDLVDRLPSRGEGGIVERPRRLGGREAAGDEQGVALARRQSQALRQPQQHGPARGRPSRLDEAQMPRRNLRVEGEVELAEATAAAPETDLVAHRGVSLSGHDAV